MQPSVGCPKPEQLHSLISGEVTAADREAFLRHLEGCNACAQGIDNIGAHDTLVDMIRQADIHWGGLDNATLDRLIGQFARLPKRDAMNVPESMLTLICPACQKKLKVKQSLQGKKVKCPGCGQAVAVPEKPGQGQMSDQPTMAPLESTPPVAVAAEQTQPYEPEASDETDFLAPPQGPGEIGRLGTYRVLRVLGKGGMGVVFEAEDPQLRRPVALKAMLPSLAASASARQRFLREARSAAAIRHDHIVAIYQVGEDRGVPFLAMEFLEGQPLDQRLKQGEPGASTPGSLSLAEILRIGREIADGLEAAHERGMIHRDIKPANIWLEKKKGRIKILDFGLARAASEEAQLTQQGAIVGTPAFMAPEQANGSAVDSRCDLFSLGCVLYRMCTGELPFKGSDTISTLMAVAMENPRPPRHINDSVPAELSDLIMKLLTKKPEDRCQKAQEVIEALARFEADIVAGQQDGKGDKVTGRQGDMVRMPESVTLSPPHPVTLSPSHPVTLSRSRRRLIAAAVLLAVLAPLAYFFAGPVIRFTTNKGEVVIRTDAADIQVTIQQQGGEPNAVVIDKEARREYVLKAGDYDLEVTLRDDKGETRFVTKKLTVSRGGRVVIEASYQLAQVGPGGKKAPLGTSPFGALMREDIPANELAAAGGGDPAKAPEGLVAIYGDSRFKLWELMGMGLFSPGGERIFASEVGFGWEAVRVWDTATGRLILSFPGKHLMALSPDGSRLATCHFSPAQIWDAHTGKLLLTIHDHKSVHCVAFSKDGKRIATGGKDHVVRIWDTTTGKSIKTLKGHTQGVRCMTFSGDGRFLASGSGAYYGPDKPGEVIIWDTQVGDLRHAFKEDHTIYSVAITPDSSTVLYSWRSGGCRFRRLDTGEQSRLLQNHQEIVLSVDGKKLVGRDHAFWLWDLTHIANKPVQLVGIPLGYPRDLSRDGRYLVFTQLSTVGLFDINAGLMVARQEAQWGRLLTLAVSPGEPRVFTTSEDGWLRVWDSMSGKELSKLRNDSDYATGQILSADGKRLVRATRSEKGSIAVCDATTGKDLVLLGDKGAHYEICWPLALTARALPPVSLQRSRHRFGA